MKILILGIDGYIGYPLAIKLLKEGHEVAGIDSYMRRTRVQQVGSDSLTPILPPKDRYDYLANNFKNFNFIERFNLMQGCFYDLEELFLEFKEPDAIIHLAEQPSAPWSMANPLQCTVTQAQNVLGTLELLWAIKEFCPKTHLIKLGTMGEYGTPGCDIPEGKIPKYCTGDDVVTFGGIGCPMSGLLFPRTPGSFYHASKVMDTINIEFACRNWNLTSTDIMQGVVYGLNDYANEQEITRFDYDECFGTVINRFAVQALVDHPLTIYGGGGQTRGYLPLKDSLQCITIVIENPPERGEYRTLNQFAETFSINEIAGMVVEGFPGEFTQLPRDHIVNPRKEAESHYYNPQHQTLFDLGYKPTIDHQGEITKLINQLLPYKDRIIKEVITPKINWV